MAKEHFERHKQPWKAEEAGQLRMLAGKGKGLSEYLAELKPDEAQFEDSMDRMWTRLDAQIARQEARKAREAQKAKG